MTEAVAALRARISVCPYRSRRRLPTDPVQGRDACLRRSFASRADVRLRPERPADARTHAPRANNEIAKSSPIQRAAEALTRVALAMDMVTNQRIALARRATPRVPEEPT